ncbi:leucyl aminopeptidase [candidate division KSB1 bacterium]|nr:leucyl aminopeptidase [candidate division KSB1 bacterium]
MNKSEKMVHAAKNAMIHVMHLSNDDKVLVVTDEHTNSIGNAFYKAAQEYGCETEIYNLPEANRPLKEIPTVMVDKLSGKSVVINAFKGMSKETPFRIKWIKKIASTRRIRLGHCPGITEKMMTTGPMNVDYKKMLDTAQKLMKSFENAAKVHITAPAGTDIKLDIENRAFSTDVRITTEHFGNLPCGEIWCAPVETAGSGVIVCDGSIGDVGNVSKPLKITLENGKITDLESEDRELVEEIDQLTTVDKEASVVGELGIGLNTGAKLTGNLLEDEKANETAHIAFGNNEEMSGGQNRSQTHRDFLFYKPTFKVFYKDGSNKILIKDGKFKI